jgi:hypothetical protein
MEANMLRKLAGIMAFTILCGGFIHADGRIPTLIYNYSFHDGLSPFYSIKARGWGFTDKTGKVAIPARFLYAGGFSEGLAFVSLREKGKETVTTAFIDKKGKIAVNLTELGFTYASDFGNGLALVETAEKKTRCYIDKTGKVVLVPAGRAYENLSGFSEGLAPFSFKEGESGDSMYGYMDTAGKEAIAPTFTFADSFSKGIAYVNLPGRSWPVFINTAGKTVCDPGAVLKEGENVADFSDGMFRVDAHDEGNGQHVSRYYDLENRLVAELKGFTRISACREGRVMMEKDYYSRGFVDIKGKAVGTGYFDANDFSEGLAAFMGDQGFRIGFINLQGKIVIPAKFDGLEEEAFF